MKQTIFPIGHLPKSAVKQIARDADISVANKKESMGVCFIGKRDFAEFLGLFLLPF